MPAKNTTLKNGERYNPLNKELWNRFVKETGTEVDYDTFRGIIEDTLELMKEALANDEAGIELPHNLGYMVVTMYKSRKTPIDWKNTKRLGKKIPLLNLHSFGYVFHIKWFKIGVRLRNKIIYKFEPYRILKRQVSKNVKEGKKYFKWSASDYWTESKMERDFQKFYKTDT